MPADQPDQEPAEPSATQRMNVLLEEIRSQIAVIAEDHRGFRSTLSSIELALEDIDERLGRLEPMVNTLAPLPKTLDDLEGAMNKKLDNLEGKVNEKLDHLEGEVKKLSTNVKGFTDQFQTFNQRLAAVESK